MLSPIKKSILRRPFFLLALLALLGLVSYFFAESSMRFLLQNKQIGEISSYYPAISYFELAGDYPEWFDSLPG